MSRIETHPLTPDRWDDLAALFETNAVTRGCWCMWFRLPTDEFRRCSGDGNRAAFRAIVEAAAVPPGVLAYLDGKPAGWCAVAPRDEYTRIGRSRTLKPVDDQPAWSIVCFFVAKHARGSGVTHCLLDAAVAFAKRDGAKIIEGYPVDSSLGQVTPDAAYHGLQPLFERAGFGETARRSPKRPIMRRYL
jgi:GNAT superfamily N-acetyltransferase